MRTFFVFSVAADTAGMQPEHDRSDRRKQAAKHAKTQIPTCKLIGPNQALLGLSGCLARRMKSEANVAASCKKRCGRLQASSTLKKLEEQTTAPLHDG